MSCDKLVFDLSQEIEGSPNVFVKKDWLSILDNMNTQYSANQSIVDTSQLANSNKFLSYREAYLNVPMIMTLTSDAATSTATTFLPATTGTSSDYALGLKNWFGTIIHSFTLDYHGTTIIQQTPFINMWNSFKLMTSLSWNDVITQGATIGFYPDDPTAFTTALPIAATPSTAAPTLDGVGICNNITSVSDNISTTPSARHNVYNATGGNNGFTKRCQYINFDANGCPSSSVLATNAYGALTAGTTTASGSNNFAATLWKSYIFNKVNSTAGTMGVLQIYVNATIYLKHLHSFFSYVPLLKGVFMKMTMALNNTTSVITVAGTGAAATSMTLSSVSNAVGGVNPLMIASCAAGSGGANLDTGSGAASTINYTANISVGATCLSSQASNALVSAGPSSKSVYLYVPAYTFNPVFEQAYLSSPIKQIKYTDVYQYQVFNVASAQPFNNLITNGIANIKSVLVLPFYSAQGGTTATGLPSGIPVYQSPFDAAGAGPTSPLCSFNNFNIQISGQNAIYNTERYSFEHFNNQLAGQNAVNGGMTDGLTSSLINAMAFEMEYCYWYVNVSRMLPVEKAVPKSVQITGINQSAKAVDLFVFIEYGSEVSIDILSGSRV